MLASVVSSSRREYLGAFRTEERDHPRRLVPAHEGDGRHTLRSGGIEDPVNGRVTRRLGTEAHLVEIRQGDAVADPHRVELHHRDGNVDHDQVALVAAHRQEALEVVDRDDRAAHRDFLERLRDGDGGRQGQAGESGQNSQVRFHHADHSRSQALSPRYEGTVNSCGRGPYC